MDHTSSGGWNFPDGTVLVQTFSLSSNLTPAAERRRIETRLFTRQQGEWAGYSYRWDDNQNDAVLVDAKGAEMVLRPTASPQTDLGVWRFPSRTDCMACHSRAANFVLGLTAAQMNRTHDYGRVRDNQLRTFNHLGLFTNRKLPNNPPALVDPYDDQVADLNARARSYLQANCSSCHMDAGGGNSKMELRYSTTAEQMNLLGAHPQHDTFGIHNAMLISPAHPERSILLQRLSRRGRGQMPPLFTARVDERARSLFAAWIAAMEPAERIVREWTWEELSPALDDVKRGRSFESGRTAFRQSGCGQCHRFAGDNGGGGPDLHGVGHRLSAPALLESIVHPSKIITAGYATEEVETKSGEVLTGRIERETATLVELRPVSGTGQTMTLLKTEIVGRAKSQMSTMPSGMLNTLQKEQILDLLAYLIADGATNAPAFAP
jgi:putative heme-binding domain-containing protein